MAGSYDLFDAQAITGSSEWSSRGGSGIDTLQIHHATMTSISGLLSLMAPGGRTVSANGAMANDGTLYEVVPVSERAFTSASSYDRRSLTVECCNTTVDANWGISDATHRRLGKLAAQMFKAGLLGGINRTFIIGHNEVPDSYATACPGPSMNLDLVVKYALEYSNPVQKRKQIMSTTITPLVKSNPPQYTGEWRLRCGETKREQIVKDDSTGKRIQALLRGDAMYAGDYADARGYVDAIEAPLPGTGGGTAPLPFTLADIAKAVNDDAAARYKA